MNYPPIFAICAADSTVVSLIGDSSALRFFPFGNAPQNELKPYAVFQTTSGIPENYLGTRPNIEQWTVTVECYAKTIDTVRQVSAAIRDAIETECHITGWRSEEYDSTTGLYSMAFDSDWFVKRIVPPVPPIPPVSCAYPLDGDITGAPFLPMTISGAGLQTATVAIAGGGTNANYLAVPSGVFPGPFATLDLSTGIRVVGFYPTVPSAVNQAGNLPAYRGEYTLVTTAFSTVLSVNITATTGGLFDIIVYVGATTAYTATGQASVPTFIAMIFNANTSTVSVQFDGTPVSLTADSYTPDTLVASVVVVESPYTAAGDAGKVVGGTIATDAADIPGTYPSGATDACGNVIT